MAPMRVKYAREVPEYEIDPKELDFSNSVEITKVNIFMLVKCSNCLCKSDHEKLLMSICYGFECVIRSV